MTLQIEIYSDVICPWCFLGKRRLERAIVSLGSRPPVKIRYLPFELNPSALVEGKDRNQYLENKYGGAIHQAHERLELMGQEVGLRYDFKSPQKIPNSFDAHRLIWLAEREGVQAELVEALFTAYFTDVRDLGDKGVLEAVALSAGLDRAKVQGLLKGNGGAEEVRLLEDRAYHLGVSGVPFFIFNGKSAISGAQSVQTFTQILEELTA